MMEWMPPPDGIAMCQGGDVCRIPPLRGQLSEHGVVAPQGPANVPILAQAIDDMTPSLPLLVVELARVYLDQIDRLSEKVAGLEKAIACEATRGAMTRRLQTMPGVKPITAMAIETFAPPMEVFRRGRDFAAWLGLVPVQHSTGGKQVLGKTSKMGQRDIRRLLITGAMVIVRWACRKGAREGTAASHARTQTAHACSDRPRQQNGPFNLGHADKGGRLSRSCGCYPLIHDQVERPRERWACEEVEERKGK
jgi:transposase